MFDFLFKRPTAPKAPKASKATTPPAPSTPGPAPAQVAASVARQQEKQSALEQARSLGADEAPALAFLLQCQFADARLIAAEKLHQQANLETAMQAMRNTDRRVEKLLQQRLQFLAHQAQQQQQLNACLESAQGLLADTQLMPNQVADLDRRWQVAGGKPDDTSFAPVREQLARRLQQQMQLQRNIRDHIQSLRAHSADADIGQSSQSNQSSQLSELMQQGLQLESDAEIKAVPKVLLQELALAQSQLAQQIRNLAQAEQQQAEQQAARQQKADADQASQANLAQPPIGTPIDAAIGPTIGANTDAGAAPEGGIDLAPVGEIQAEPIRPRPAKNKSVLDPALLQQFANALDALEKALEQGLLHAAFEHDKTLRELKQVRPNAQQAARLGQARAELHRLQGWAKWGGNVSREELVKAVEELGAQDLSMVELAKKVGSMRERWKKLDTASGAAPKSLWERFDNACTQAYAPAAAHFKKLSEERQHNLQQAQGLLEQIEQFNASFVESQADWRQVSHFAQRQRQHWQQLGPLERKDKKRLDQEFERLMAHSGTPLAEQRRHEAVRREQMIKQVQACNPHDRATLDLLRQLQERWQEQAKALPLERKPEQDLWQRFRSACDAVFATRKESAQVADSERRTHLQAKEALCTELEGQHEAQEAAKLLRSSQDAWHQIGAVPRAQEQAIEQRFQRARQALQQQIEQAKRAARREEHTRMRQKLELCQQLEASLLEPDCAINATNATHWQTRWQAIAPLGRELENTLLRRFEAALQASAPYIQKLRSNREQFLNELLRLEIILSLDSPEPYARERLKIQVEVLQSSLRSGQKAEAPQAQVLRLCALPVLLDEPDMNRLERVLLTLLS